MNEEEATDGDTFDVCGVAIKARSIEECADSIVESAVLRKSIEVHLCNVYTLALSGRDNRLFSALRAGHLNIADGSPIALLGRKSGINGPVRGPDLLGEVAQRGIGKGVRHYLYGGAPGVAELVKAELEKRFPGVTIVCAESPPYTPISGSELQGLVERISSTQATVVWIGLGTPKQDYLVRDLGPYVNAPLVPIGAAFEFWSGRVKQAPPVVRGSGFEWLFRLAHEPKRLWRRYLLDGPRFLIMLIRSWHGRPR